jgi:hypothetical protein
MAAGTAVVAGTATAVSGRVARRQNAKYENESAAQQPAQQQGYYEQPPSQGYSQPNYQGGAQEANISSELERLAMLKQQGLLTDEEFAAAKSKMFGM